MIMVADNVLFPHFHHRFLSGGGGGRVPGLPSPADLKACHIIATVQVHGELRCCHTGCSFTAKRAINDCGRECRHAVRKRSEWLAAYSGVRKRISVQFTFAAAVRGRTEREAFMSARSFGYFSIMRKVTEKNVENKIITLRAPQVILDADVAELYGADGSWLTTQG